MKGFDQEAIVGSDILYAGSGCADTHRRACASIDAAGGDAGATTDIIAPDIGAHDVSAGEREGFGDHLDGAHDRAD